MKSQDTSQGMKFSIKFKFILMISILCLSIGVILSTILVTRTKFYLEEEYQGRGILIAKNIAFNSVFGLTEGDPNILKHVVDGAMAQQSDLAYVIILDTNKKVLAHTDPKEVGTHPKDNFTNNATKKKSILVVPNTYKGTPVYDIAHPVGEGRYARNKNMGRSSPSARAFYGDRIGTIRIGLSLKSVKAKVWSLIWSTVALVSVVVALAIALGFVFVRIIVKPIGEMAVAATQISRGDFSKNVSINSDDEIGILGTAFGQMLSNLRGMVRRIQEVSEHVTEGAEKMRVRNSEVRDGAQTQVAAIAETSLSIQKMDSAINNIGTSIDSLSHSSEVTASSLGEMSVAVSEVANNTVALATSVEDTSSSLLQVSASLRNVVDNVTQLSAATEETNRTVNEIDSSIKKVEENAKQSAVLSEKVKRDAEENGMKSIEKTISGMERIRKMVDRSSDVINKLGQKTDHIGKILTVIDEVTRQTNLLALNAAILAAQAGEEGKGFTVVADEIKNLSDRTSSSTKEISQLIGSVQSEAKEAVSSIKEGLSSVEEGMQLSVEARDALRKIVESSQKSSEMCRSIEGATLGQVNSVQQVLDSTRKVSDMVEQIARATQEQNRGTEQITRSSEVIRNITRQVKAATEEQAKGTQQISGSVENISSRIQQIALAIQEQKKSSEVIMNSVIEIRDVTQGSVQSAQVMNLLVEDFLKQTELLKGEISQFRIT